MSIKESSLQLYLTNVKDVVLGNSLVPLSKTGVMRYL